MVAGYILNAALTFCYLFVKTPFHLFIVQAGLGAAEAIVTTTWDALYVKNLNEKIDTYAWGFQKVNPRSSPV
ncbi:MAG: hypothetical protein JSS98_00955 [Bacteroidetes bacterium]|nr:hypothetical protein [Bacteroidota bacterium]